MLVARHITPIALTEERMLHQRMAELRYAFDGLRASMQVEVRMNIFPSYRIPHCDKDAIACALLLPRIKILRLTHYVDFTSSTAVCKKNITSSLDIVSQRRGIHIVARSETRLYIISSFTEISFFNFHYTLRSMRPGFVTTEPRRRTGAQ